MALSVRSLELLIDLVEIKLSYMNVTDREDAKEHAVLENCLSELKAMHSLHKGSVTKIGQQTKEKKRVSQ